MDKLGSKNIDLLLKKLKSSKLTGYFINNILNTPDEYHINYSYTIRKSNDSYNFNFLYAECRFEILLPLNTIKSLDKIFDFEFKNKVRNALSNIINKFNRNSSTKYIFNSLNLTIFENINEAANRYNKILVTFNLIEVLEFFNNLYFIKLSKDIKEKIYGLTKTKRVDEKSLDESKPIILKDATKNTYILVTSIIAVNNAYSNNSIIALKYIEFNDIKSLNAKNNSYSYLIDLSHLAKYEDASEEVIFKLIANNFI